MLYLGIWLSSLLVPERGAAPHHEAQGSILTVLKRPTVIAYLAAWLSDAGEPQRLLRLLLHLYGRARLLQHLRRTRCGPLGVVAEVLIFLVMHRLLQRWGARQGADQPAC